MALSLDQARAAYRVGLARSQAGRTRNGVHRFDWHPDPKEQRHVDGMSAVAECLVGVVTGRRWTSQGLEPDRPEDGDVEGGISVRWTPRRGGCLIVHPDEHDELRCVLVVGDRPPLRIHGWMLARTAKQARWWRTDVRHPAYFVPQQGAPWESVDSLRVTSPAPRPCAPD